MLNENAKAWVQALRSGEYQQTRNQLRRTTQYDDDGPPVGYCCLGVACDLYIKANPDLAEWVDELFVWEPEPDGNYKYEHGIADCLPAPVAIWLGMGKDPIDVTVMNETGRYEVNWGEHRTLIEDNDGTGTTNKGAKSFDEIAAIIESDPGGLFRD